MAEGASWAPKNPGYREAVQKSFDRQPAMAELGIRIADIQPGLVQLELPFNSRFTQQHGFLHGGIVTTALDTACGYAAFSLMPAEAAVLTVEFKTNLLAPASGDSFIFVGRATKSGRTLSVCEGRAFSRSKSGTKLIASMSATLMALFDREGIRN